ncbi:putative phage abortive infection protein [Salipaludibacillus aurantiacus]|uniref:Putative phage abortive infection protein n=1 Tax=Salipaludibacillus aurantiacus TaxID=1601833 RepID=A0A1H9ULG6_9BACI|nr:putative phage abortive infection protein [Salipaludibacillus aurantiacus]SES10202.1 Putative phage abortive infection protein [Salipaludibacillus aurantiacus]
MTKYLLGVINNKYFLILMFLAISFPIFVSWIVSLDNFMWYEMAYNNDWISFLGSYLGGIFGGLFTLFGVLITIKKQEQQGKKVDLFQFENSLFRLLSLKNESVNNIEFEVNQKERVKGKMGFEWISREIDEIFNGLLNEEYKKYGVDVEIDLEYHIINQTITELYSKYGTILAHYFINVSYILESISQLEENSLKVNYTSILKAQLSQAELKVIFYHSIVPVGHDLLYNLVNENALFDTFDNSFLIDAEHSIFFEKIDEFLGSELNEISLFLDNDNYNSEEHWE